MLILNNAFYEYTEVEEQRMWALWKRPIKMGRYRCPVRECKWKPKKGSEWRQCAEHFFEEHLTCPYCPKGGRKLNSLLEFGAHFAVCEWTPNNSVSETDLPF